MSYEAGIRPQRMEFVRETSPGVIASSPNWQRFSDYPVAARVTLGNNPSLLRTLGNIDPDQVHLTPEDNTFAVDYILQSLDDTGTDRLFKDGSGNSQNAITDAIERNSDNELLNTHSFIAREEHNLGGVAGNGVRLYIHARGAYPGVARIPGDPDDTPQMVTIEYTAMELRAYIIHQPASGGELLNVQSTDDADTMDVTLENEDASETDTVTLTGTTPVSTTQSFTGLDVVRALSAPAGNITVEDQSANVLATLYGTAEYDGIYGEQGMPTLTASGSHGSALGGAKETFPGQTVERPGGTALAENFYGLELVVENNVQPQSRDSSLFKDIRVGNRDVTLTSTEFGETVHHQSLREAARLAEDNLVWTFQADQSNQLTLSNAHRQEGGELTKETDQARSEAGVTYQGLGITIGTA